MLIYRITVLAHPHAIGAVVYTAWFLSGKLTKFLLFQYGQQMMSDSRNPLSNSADDAMGIFKEEIVSSASLQLLVDVVRSRISNVLLRYDEELDDDLEEVLRRPQIRDQNVQGEVYESGDDGGAWNSKAVIIRQKRGTQNWYT